MVDISPWVWILIWAPPIGGTVFTIWYWYFHTPSILKKIKE